ncbi:MAG: endonuclease III [Candidatus Roizmanbacteria bacterium]|nr:endonuclease III [Candidatus Roizmanbacteria bacterium]
MTKKERVTKIIIELNKLFPRAQIMLNYSSPWELLVAVILSAQCTDKMVNRVTEKLFKKYQILEDYINADVSEFEKDNFATGFYRMKAKHILASAHIIKNKYNGEVPKSMVEILKLPGVGRKTANVVLGNAYGVIEGIAVDTHVIRLSHILRLSKHTDPKNIEKDLMKVVPHKEWLKFTYLLIEYGRKYCSARKHDHKNCPMTRILSKVS